MNLTLLNIYPIETIARYLLSSYLLKAYLNTRYKGREGLSVNVIDFNNKTAVDAISERLLETRPDIIGYSSYIWNIEKILEVIKYIKGRKGNVVHILGGPEMSRERIMSFKDPSIADYYVIGEGERKLAALINHLEPGSGAALPKGIARWDRDRLDYTVDTETIKNLDEVPSIYLTGAIEDRLYERQEAFIETQRGCRYRCRYCVYHKNIPSRSYYSLPRVLNELDYLIVEKHVRALRFFDAIFSSDLTRAKDIARHLADLKKKKGIRLPWIYWEFTSDAVDKEFIELAASLKDRPYISNASNTAPLDRPQHYSDMVRGYNVINCVGIQSFSGKALAAAGRASLTEDGFGRFMKLARDNNIVLKLDLILGLPLETFESYFNGLEFLIPHLKGTDHILNIHRLQILPGSELESLCGQYAIRYSKEAPHIVQSTGNLSEVEIDRASRLTAILFRILNSPLRNRFFEASERLNRTYYDLIAIIYNELSEDSQFKSTRLIKGDIIDDIYWNDEIFHEIPSKWLIGILEKRSDKLVRG